MRSEFTWQRLACHWLPVVLLCILIAPPARVGSGAGASSSPDASASDSPDARRRAGEQLFNEKIAPIFAQRCLSCHSAKKAHGLLRLDAREDALRGGDTHGRVAEVDAADNYLWQRVSSTDEDERMPAGGEPLTDEQMADLRHWVELSAPWPDMSEGSAGGEQVRTSRREPVALWVRAVLASADAVDKAMLYQAYFPLSYLLLALLCPMALAARVRRQRAAQGPMWRARAWKLWLARSVNGYFYITSAAALVIFGMWLHVGVIEREKTLLGQAKQQLADELAAYNPARSPQSNVDTLAAVFPKHPNRIGGTYYRGNDERNAALYNGGVYCTCKFQLELRGSDGKALQTADRVPAGPLSLRLEIERAPFAAEALFSRHVIGSTFLSRTAPNKQDDALSEKVREFTPMVKGQRWEASYPLGAVLATAASQEFSGRVFLYNGGLSETVLTASPHYSIDYKLQIVDGQLMADSDLRMGVIYLPGAVLLAPQGRIPVDEWFSDRPLWEIVGGNTSDPTLLGIKPHEERLGKTLEKDSSTGE